MLELTTLNVQKPDAKRRQSRLNAAPVHPRHVFGLVPSLAQPVCPRPLAFGSAVAFFNGCPL